MKRIGIPLVALGLLAFANAALAQPGVQDFLVDLNRTALGAYHQGRQTLFDRTSPILVVAFDELVLRREGVETRERFTPPLYHQLKSISHLALGIHGAGFLGKFYAEDIENADRNPQEALQAIGAGKVKTLWYGVLPQVLPQYIAYTLYILDRNVRMATVIGIVGAGGIGLELKGRFDMFNFGHVGTILLIIFITVFLLDQFSARLRSRVL